MSRSDPLYRAREPDLANLQDEIARPKTVLPTDAQILRAFSVGTLAELRKTPGSIDGNGGPRVCMLAGHLTALDAGAGLFVWDATSTAADDATTAPNANAVTAVYGVRVGRWRRLSSLCEAVGTIVGAATVDLSTVTGETVTVTGTPTITSFGVAASGVFRRLLFTSSAGQITHNATSLVCPNAASIQTKVGDVVEVVSLGSGNWKVVNVQYASVGFGTTAGAEGMYAAGALVLQCGASFLLPLVPLRNLAGTVGSPAITFNGDLNSGFYLIAASDFGFSIASTQQFHVTASGLLHSTRHQAKMGAAVASATTITLGGDGNVFSITGTTAVTGITATNWQAGSRVTLIPASASITLGHNTGAGGIRTKTGAAVAPVAGNAYDLVYDGTTWDLL